MQNSYSSELLALLQSGIDQKLFSAAQLVVQENSRCLLSLAVGKTRTNSTLTDSFTHAAPVSVNTLFDVASLTKPIATASLVMKACDDGLLSTDQKLIYIDGVKFPSWLLSYTIQDLLSHQTPLQAWHDFHGPNPHLDNYEAATHLFQQTIYTLPDRDDGKSWCYSDLGFILLGFILENCYQKPLPELFRHKIAAPLGLSECMMFSPLHHFSRTNIAATCAYQNAYIQGHPDDANARVLCHAAGHAGLFATAEAIALFVHKLLSGQFPCHQDTIHQFIHYKSPKTPFALGWDRPTSNDSLSGRCPGDNVIGHLGFTGCSVWIDLDTARSVTLLTNRTHLNDDPKSIANIRRDIHRICWNI